MKKHILVFLSNGIPFGLIMVGWDYFDGLGFNLKKFLFLSIFFGLWMTVMLHYINQVDGKSKPKTNSKSPDS